MILITWECQRNPKHHFRTNYHTDLQPCLIDECRNPCINRLLSYYCDFPGCPEKVDGGNGPANWHDISMRIAQWNSRGSGLFEHVPYELRHNPDSFPAPFRVYNVVFCSKEHMGAWLHSLVENDYALEPRNDIR